ncbi:MAG TPA: FHA domain-containing protein [Solirubrobacteraceae bacterium]|nr:FHA domain-containing protein [Solirubrobacteraceae bacterium]
MAAQDGREALAGRLQDAFVLGLLSEQTLCDRLALLYGSPVLHGERVVGDLTVRRSGAARSLERTLGRLDRLLQRRERPTILVLERATAEGEALIGRSASCPVCLQDPSVSRRHATLARVDDGYLLRDLDSTNGTWVGRRRVGRVIVRPGDRVWFGGLSVVLD